MIKNIPSHQRIPAFNPNNNSASKIGRSCLWPVSPSISKQTFKKFFLLEMKAALSYSSSYLKNINLDSVETKSELEKKQESYNTFNAGLNDLFTGFVEESHPKLNQPYSLTSEKLTDLYHQAYESLFIQVAEHSKAVLKLLKGQTLCPSLHAAKDSTGELVVKIMEPAPSPKQAIVEGGGGKASANEVLLDLISENAWLEEADQVAGASSGSIVACAFMLGLSRNEYHELSENHPPDLLVSSIDSEAFNKAYGNAGFKIGPKFFGYGGEGTYAIKLFDEVYL